MRRCIGICDRLEYVKSLRWVNKYEYRHCAKCAKYFKTSELRCECCKDPLRIYYKPGIHVKINMKRKRNNIWKKLHYIINHDTYVMCNLVYQFTKGAQKIKYDRRWREQNKARIVNYRHQYYLTNYK